MRLRYLFRLLVCGSIGALVLTACGGPEPKAVVSDNAAELAADAAAGYISASKAGEHMGEVATVKGSVTDYRYNTGAKGKPYIFVFDEIVARADVRGHGRDAGLPGRAFGLEPQPDRDDSMTA